MCEHDAVPGTAREERGRVKELRIQINYRLSADSNVSIAISHVVDHDDDVGDIGAEDCRVVSEYMAGYGRGLVEP